MAAATAKLIRSAWMNGSFAVELLLLSRVTHVKALKLLLIGSQCWMGVQQHTFVSLVIASSKTWLQSEARPVNIVQTPVVQ